jgi:hypothetical protein
VVQVERGFVAVGTDTALLVLETRRLAECFAVSAAASYGTTECE